MRRSTLFLLGFILLCLLLAVFVFIPVQATRLYGPPSPRLGLTQRVQYSARLLWHDGLLTTPVNINGSGLLFEVSEGETVGSVAKRLNELGLIRDSRAFLDYLIYMGMDTSLQAGSYTLSPAMSIIDIARDMQDSSPLDVAFVVLPGWRMEEIAASLPTSGLDATPEAFLSAARTALREPFLADASTNEGFLFPDRYVLPRATDAQTLVETLVRNFALHLTAQMQSGIENQGLTVYQAVIIASLVERETIKEQEMPTIASVFLNRWNAGWKMESDPTVQYAIGTDGNWWPNPLSALDLNFDSPFNTYLYSNLPPAPIANPSLEALQAVADPASTNYFFFRAQCDGSGLHNFAETLEEHINNGCE
ncbi:MAG: Endolytic murein transglycosylase [Anaerolineales bacterium]|nr:Endolytic murein transglycosylase [Anaerolineales bacterium]